MFCLLACERTARLLGNSRMGFFILRGVKMKKARSHWGVAGTCGVVQAWQQREKMTRRLWLALLVCAWTVMLGGVSQAWAFATECEGGHWELVETKRDQWGYPNSQSTFVSYGTTMGFWEQPTSCTDVAYEGENKLEYIKTLVCVSSALVKIQEAPGGSNCVIEGKAIPATGPYAWPTTNPCVVGVYMGGGGYVSNYGDVTIAKKYEKV